MTAKGTCVLKQTLILSLWLLRIILVCWPQTGYIHPDEFFQSVEVAAGDILDVEGKRTWEFNSNVPIRSGSIIQATAGFPLYLLKILDQLLSSISVMTSYSVLITPRLFLVLLSFMGDFCVWNLSQKFSVCPKTSLLLYASSFVTLVFYTRTLSNTTESFLFNILLLFALSDVKSSPKETIDQKTSADDENIDETFGNIWYQTVMCSIFMGVLLACGIFNRPTFVIFALVPVVLWMQNSYSLFTLLARLLYLATGFSLMSSLLVCLDTVYFRTDLVDLHVDIKFCLEKSENVVTCLCQAASDHFVFTPWNFIIYNTNKDNLASHGAHPWYLHLTANALILFGPLSILGVCALIKACCCEARYCLDWRQKKLWPLVWIFYLPSLLLSVFPHQEPRFIIPLLTPMVLLAAHMYKPKSGLFHLFTFVWIIFNAAGVVLFGFFHQGGVVPSLMHLQSNESTLSTGASLLGGQKVMPPTAVSHMIYFHTYMPPEHLLLKYRKMPFNDRGRSKTSATVRIHDLKGGEDFVLEELISNLKEQAQQTDHLDIYVIAPFTWVFSNCHKFDMKWVQSFTPHLTLEDPPDLFRLITHAGWTNVSHCLPPGDKFVLLYRLRNMFSLILLKVQ
ncbi:GPI mannosyltransferase 4-like [Liolophura sinensis]|uniref:GPI mannosyltransferase 4-like n=1 Tax=Liolophura sinensis TaxID=3198878 RepID=UPI0031595E17